MENVRYRVATTTRKNKSASYDTTAAIVNSAVAVSSRQAPSAGDSENYHAGKWQRSRRRDVHAVPDDFVRVSTTSHPASAVVDAVRRRVEGSDVHAKTPSFWAQPPAFAAGSGTEARSSRSRSRPRPPFLLERGAQRGEIPGEYIRDSADSSRLQQQQLTEDSHRRQRGHQRQQQQQQPHHVAGLKPSVEFAGSSAVDCRRPSPTSLLPGRTITSPTPASLSPSYLSDNKALLKEALISAAAAKLARSSSARSAAVRPLVVIRNGPPKSTSDEHVDAGDDVITMTTTTTVTSPLSSPTSTEPAEHTADVAVAAAAAAAAAATRRSRTRRRDADQITSSSVTTSAAASGTSQTDSVRTRRTAAANCDASVGDQVSQSSVAASSVSGNRMQDSVGFRRTRAVDYGGSPSAAAQILPSSSNYDHADKSRRLATIPSTPTTVAADTTRVSETLSAIKGSSAGGNRKDLRQSTSDTPKRDRDVERVDKTINDSNVTEPKTMSAVADAGPPQELPSCTSKVSFIKSILSRTRSPSPSRRRRSKSKVSLASPSPSSVKQLGAEVAQRISEPVKGYLKQLRDRSSQRRRQPEPATTGTTKAADEPEPSASQDREIASVVESQPRSSNACPSAGPTASCNDHSTDDMSNQGGEFKTDRKKQDDGASVLTAQWKSTSELTTPMSRLDSLLKANSLQHLQSSTTAALRTNGSLVDDTSGTSSSTSSRLPLLSKTSRSTGCLLSSSAGSEQSVERQRATTMSRCYLEKPRVARRAVTVQLDRRQPPSLDVSERQSTSQADLRNQQPAAVSSLNEAPCVSGKLTKDNDVSKQSTDDLTPETTAAASTWSASRQLDAGDRAASSQNERDLRELYEQKRLERKLEEKLAMMEKERAETIAKLWSQIDRRCETNATTRPRTPAVIDHLRNSSSSSGLVLPLPYNTSSTESSSQVNTRLLNRSRPKRSKHRYFEDYCCT